MKTLHIAMLLACAAGAALAQPTITAIQNSASNIPAGLPNAGVAEGSLFIVKGSGLGGASFVVANAYPLQTTIAGTSVSVTVGNLTVSAIMYYAGATQVAAILPSRVPTGTGTLTVTYNGQTSQPFPIVVVQSALGLFTVAQNGTGDAIAFLNSNNSLITPTNAANPNDVVVFWGTGLGPVTFDETGAAQQFDMTNIPLEAYIGGTTANVLFRGRNACCSSVDVVYLRVPAGVSGCAVPVTFKIGSIVSNTVTIAVASNGRVCTPTTPSVTTSEVTQFVAGGTYRFGSVGLARAVVVTPPITVSGITIPGSSSRSDTGYAGFVKETIPAGGAGTGSSFDVAAYGSCTVTSYSSGSDLPSVDVQETFLDAGAQITVAGPGGTKTLAKQVNGTSISYGAQFDMTGTYLNAGTYNISGPGGADVGSFNETLVIPQPLTWTNQQTTLEVDRSAGVTLNWTGGDPAGYVQIGGGSSLINSDGSSVTVSFVCTARTTAGTFTVPPIVLLAVPPSGSLNGITLSGSLALEGYTLKTFKASGIDFGALYASVGNANLVTYK